MRSANGDKANSSEKAPFDEEVSFSMPFCPDGGRGRRKRERSDAKRSLRAPQFTFEHGNQSSKGFVNGLFLQLTLPYDMHVPTFFFEKRDVSLVALDIALEFGNPVVLIRLRHGRMAIRAAMPKTAIDEETDFFARVRHIRTSGNLPLKAISTEPRFAQTLSHDEFGQGVFALVAAHALAHGRSNRACWPHDGVKNTSRNARVLSHVAQMLAPHRNMPKAAFSRTLDANGSACFAGSSPQSMNATWLHGIICGAAFAGRNDAIAHVRPSCRRQ